MNPQQSSPRLYLQPLVLVAGLAWRMGLRDARSGALRLLLLALVLAVAAYSAVGFVTQRVGDGLLHDAAQLLGGDVVLASDNPSPLAALEQARRWGLRSSSSVVFSTMARAPDALGGGVKLVSLKAVGGSYPLRGSLRSALSARPDDPGQQQNHGPQPGQVWAEAAVLAALGLQVGNGVMLGERQLLVAAVLQSEPDRGAGFMAFAPRVMMHQDDLPSTQLVQPASRLNYRLALVGPAAAVQGFSQWAQAQLDSATGQSPWRGVRLETLQSGRPELRQTLDRAQDFLRLVALLTALLCAVAVALAARAFAQSRLDSCAVMRVLGLGQVPMAWAFVLELAGVALLASSVGVLLGYAVQHGLVHLLGGVWGLALPAASGLPALQGVLLGLLLVATFALPLVLQLAQVPPLRVLRRELGSLRPAALGVWLLGLAGVGVVLVLVSSQAKVGLLALGGFVLAAALFAGVAWAVLWLWARCLPAGAPLWLRLASRQLCARPGGTVLRTSALALGLLALVLLVLLRTDLVAGWRAATPADAPNRFVINVLPEQSQAFQQQLHRAGVGVLDWYPMVRARLVAVNGRPVSAQDYPDTRAQRLVEREFNPIFLSYPVAAAG